MEVVLTQDKAGNWVEAEPLKMKCEHWLCDCTEGRDYKRKMGLSPFGLASKWKDEPIFLCEKHSAGYTPIMNIVKT